MKKILLVDDDRVTLTMMQMILSKGGYEVLTAIDGEEGNEKAQDTNPDLIISDILIPKVDGLELCRRVKQDPPLNHTKVILMSGVYKGATFKVEAKEAGADDFVEKPYGREDLLRRVESLIGVGEKKPERNEGSENSSD